MSKFDEKKFLEDSDESENNNSSSESSSESSSSGDSDSDENQQRTGGVKRKWEESESDEEEVRVVKTQAQKRVEAMREIILKIKENIIKKDFNTLYELFEKLNKELLKHKSYFDKEGIPKMYVFYIFYLEQVVKKLTPEEKKKLSPTNNKAYNTLKQKLKKNRAPYEAQLALCEQDHKAYYNSEEENKKQQQSDSDSEAENKKKSKKNKKKKYSEDDDEKLDENVSSSEEETEEQVARDMKRFKNSNDPMERRKFWLKKSYLYPNLYPPTSDDEKSEEYDSDEEKRKKEERKKKKEEQERKRQEELENDENFNIMKIQKRVLNFKNTEEIQQNLREVVDNRTKVKTQKKYEYFDMLQQYFYHFADQNQEQLEIIMILLPLSVDLGKSMSPTHMPRDIWLNTTETLIGLLRILSKTKDASKMTIQTYKPLYKKEGDKEIEIVFENDEQEKEYRYHTWQQVQQSLVTYLITLEFEIYKSFKNIEHTVPEYDQRVHDLYSFLKLCKQSQDYYQSVNDMHSVAKIAMKRIENTYYIHDQVLNRLREQAKQDKKQYKDEFYATEDSLALMNELSGYVYQYDSNNKSNVYKVLLFQMYHHAIHDRTTEARDLLLMSHVSELIQNNESPFYIHYIRFLAQQGLAYFRQGQIKDANLHFKEIYINKRKTVDTFNQQVKGTLVTERKRGLPYHMFINTEVLDACNLITGIILDLPTLVVSEKKQNQQLKLKNISFKTFYDQYNYNPKTAREIQSSIKTFAGPIEAYPEIIFAACRAAMRGNWSDADQHLRTLKIWKHFSNADQVKDLLTQQIKQVSFKSYIIYYKSSFDSLSLNQLAEQFQLTINQIKTIISKLIVKKKITASLHGDENNNYLVYQQSNKSKQEFWANQLIDKINIVAAQNDNIMYNGSRKLNIKSKKQQQKK